MSKALHRAVFYLTAWLVSTGALLAQTKISGNITDATTREGLVGISVQVQGKVIGTITDSKGNFSLTTNTPTPFTLVVTSIGYETQEIKIEGNRTDIKIVMKEQALMGQEVVVSASRVEEGVLQSPVTVEKMDIRAIRETPAASFYDGLANLKGIDMATQSLLFKSINMRGFGSTGNPRTVQMIDGMDNSAPGLNFPIDNIVGMPELDVESVEILPGAASALYGPNAINGLVLMNSKSPFLYQGLSAAVKTGVMSANNRTEATTPFGDFSIRYAKAFNNKFAFKINLGYIQAKDWQSSNYTNLNVGGNADPLRGAGTDTDFDGTNIYGDEVQANMRTVANGLIAAGSLPSAALALIPNTDVSRTGIVENGLVDNNVKSFKFNGALHYRINDKVEAVAQVNYGYGTTLYTGTGKYSLRGFNLTQAKLELRGDNFTLRAYTTQERSGDSYTAGLTALGMLNDVKPHATWLGEYVGGYAQARGAGVAEAQAHLLARQNADKGMPAVGSDAYNTLLDKWRNTPITKGGGTFLDKTNLYHAEGVYNFKNQVKFMDLLVGGNIRQYQLRSEGTLFADQKDGRNGTIPINEYGAFAQAAKSLFNNHLKLSASIRYDKNQNFEGQFSPRLSAVTTFGQQNIRLSYQTGFRIPTTQNQYIDLQTPGGTLIGGLPEFDSRYKLSTGVLRQTLVDFSINPTKYITPQVLAQAQAYATAAVTAQLPAIQAGVLAAVTAQVTAGVTAQVNAAVAAGQIPAAQAAAAIQAGVAQQLALPATQSAIASNVQATVVQQVTAVTTQVAPAYGLAALPKYKAKALTPERVKSIEIGYKGLVGKKLLIDASYYHSTYKNFIGGVSVVVPLVAGGPGLPIESGLGSASTRAGYSRPANSDQDIVVTGFSIALNYSLPKNFFIGGNFANNTLQNFTPTPELETSGFNTPTNRYNVNFGKRISSGNKIGFNIALKQQDAFLWESNFVVPTTAGVSLFSNTQVPAITNLDAQVSYKMSSLKSILKVGGTNLFGKPYFQAYGSPSIGSMYYVSLTFDELLNK
ncbi:carboxypeptidase-like regulatory domain-containing protein [Runella sp.]|uniref:carboxypeptidase-like regulatory domain-containing protein n=1 Tax=Runella sp. TaxID=1960881 RepID=UPI00301786EA